MGSIGPNYVGVGGSAANSGTWATLSSAEGSGASTYATWTSTTSGATATWEGTAFNVNLPASAALDSILVECQHKENSTTFISALTGQLFTLTNLLDANTADFESTLGLWSAAQVSLSSTHVNSGAQAGTVTGVSATTSASSFFTLSAATLYNAGIWVYTAGASQTATLGVQFYDSSSTSISTSTGASTPLTQNAWTYVAVGIASSPTGTAHGRLIVTFGASNTFWIDTASIGTPVAVGTATTYTRATSNTNSTFTNVTGVNAADVGNLRLRVKATHNASTSSGVESIDFARITANYHIVVPLIPNNQFAVADQSVESGVGNWIAGSNTTLASSGTQFFDGALSLQATSTASGNIAVQWNGTKEAATAGTTYEFSFQVWSPVTTTCNAEVDWYNGATFVGYDDLLVIPGAVTNLVPGWNTVTLRAPAAATTTGAVPIVIPLATTAGQAFYVDALYFGPPQITNVPAADTGVGADAASVKAAVPALETGSGSDAATVSAAIPAADTGVGVDAAAVAFPLFPAADTGTGVDAGTVAAQIPAADVGAGADTATVTALIPATDSGSFADAAGVTATIPAADTGVGVDAGIAGASAPASDTGVGVDAATIVALIPATDSGSFADAAGVAASIPASDSGVGVDAGSAGALASGTDTGSGVDAATIRLGVAETGVGLDAAGVVAQIPATDAFAGVDAASVLLPGAADAFTGLDTAKVIIVAADTMVGVDAASLTAHIPAADTATGVDALVRPLTASDTGVFVDAATVTALGHPSPSRTIVIDPEPRVWVVAAEPRRLTVDSESRLTIIGADQRTLVVPAEPRIYTVAGG